MASLERHLDHYTYLSKQVSSINSRYPPSCLLARFTPSRVTTYIAIHELIFSTMSNNDYILICLIVLLIYKTFFVFATMDFRSILDKIIKKILAIFLVYKNIYIYIKWH